LADRSSALLAVKTASREMTQTLSSHVRR